MRCRCVSETWLITNAASGSYDEKAAGRVAKALAATRRITLPDDDLPDARAAAGAERIVIMTGDGTVSGAVDALEGWEGELLILPGGTMNLLSRKLHGDAGVDDIVAKVAAGEARTRTLPIARGAGQRSLVGIIAGPTTAWGEVREAMRRFDVRTLIEAIPEAVRETTQGDLVSLEGDGREYQAIFIDAAGDGLEAQGVNAGTVAEMAQHGWAWLRGDFMGGPSEDLGTSKRLTVVGKGKIGLLVDGERAEANSPCTFELGNCPLTFLATKD